MVDISAGIALYQRFGRFAAEFVHGEIAAEIMPPIPESLISDKDVFPADKEVEIVVIGFRQIRKSAFAANIRLHSDQYIYFQRLRCFHTVPFQRRDLLPFKTKGHMRKSVVGDTYLFESQFLSTRRVFHHGAFAVGIGRVRMIIRR